MYKKENKKLKRYNKAISPVIPGIGTILLILITITLLILILNMIDTDQIVESEQKVETISYTVGSDELGDYIPVTQLNGVGGYSYSSGYVEDDIFTVYVKDQNGKPIKDVTVTAKGANYYESHKTDNNGKIIFKLYLGTSGGYDNNLSTPEDEYLDAKPYLNNGEKIAEIIITAELNGQSKSSATITIKVIAL